MMVVMQSKAATVEAYLPEERREAIEAFHEVILKNLPKGYEEGIFVWDDQVLCAAFDLSGWISLHADRSVAVREFVFAEKSHGVLWDGHLH